MHTGTPADGGRVEVWDDETGITNQAFMSDTNAQRPHFRSGASALMKAGLTELDFDGLQHRLGWYNQTGSALRNAVDVLSLSGHVVMVVVYPEAITSVSTTPWLREAVIAAENDNWGIYLWNDAGARRCTFYCSDGTDHVASLQILLTVPAVIVARHTGTTIILGVVTSTSSLESAPVTCGPCAGLSTALWLGRTTHEYFNGRVGELKIWDSPDADGNLTAEVSALAAKWLTVVSTGQPLRRRLGGVPHQRIGRPLGGRSW